eukprot:TRINITY_DN17953_c0_g1_i1.p1 TRINITY_DN17953_c0_g1~~TRINITY_DN17953_c0_g1_i1.p1  ORF type:complete len:275 (-),score=46.53 TRINITY_DN17953_c0_g1_i1:39-821(-)
MTTPSSIVCYYYCLSLAPGNNVTEKAITNPKPKRSAEAIAKSEATHLSKALSYMLRHAGPNHKLEITTAGYARIEDILNLPYLAKVSKKIRRDKPWTVEDVLQVAAADNKQRYSILEQTDNDIIVHWIRANQGHSIQVPDLELKKITEDLPQDYSVVVHGTYFEAWEKIKKSKGLSRMKRTHIHFAKGEYGSANVISGMRASCHVLVYIDLVSAIKDGIIFLESTNGVILTEGIEGGYVPKKYFSKVCVSANSTELDFQK